MIRTSKHILSGSNQVKINLLDTLYSDYRELLQIYVKMILDEQLPRRSFLSSKELPNVNSITHSQWKQVAYKQATEMVKSLIKKTRDKTYKRYKFLYARCVKENIHSSFTSKRFNELNINFIKRTPNINIQNLSIPIDNRLFDVKLGNIFDEFIRIKTPYFPEGKKRSITVNVPIKHHRQSNKFIKNEWERKNTIHLKKVKNNFYFSLFWKKEQTIKNTKNKVIGIDVGYKKLISSSSGVHYGQELNKIYDKISRKQQGSKKFKRALMQRNELINFYVKEFIETEQPDEVIIESLKNVKHKSSGKIYNKTMNMLQRWSYDRTFNKLTQLSESKGFIIKKVNPAYTSQTCSRCGNIHKESRKGEQYECVNCGMKLDADYNAALNILKRGAYGPSTTENLTL
jgi:IS605 OrfB family transposase